MKIVFNSSLPRSGSTLLQNILSQNPAFVCSATSGLMELLYGARANFTNCPEFKAQDQHEMEQAFLSFCRGGLEGWYRSYEADGVTVAVDKSRAWMAYYGWLRQFHHDAKVIVCIRDLRAIYSSMEKLWRKNQLRQSAGENPGKMEFLTVDARVGYWMQNPPIGLACQRLADAIHRGDDKHFHFVKFEDLVVHPQLTLGEIYHYLDEPYSSHDFNGIRQLTKEDDSIYGIPDLHTIRPVLKPVAEDWNTILGPHLSDLIIFKHEWFYRKFYPAVWDEALSRVVKPA